MKKVSLLLGRNSKRSPSNFGMKQGYQQFLTNNFSLADPTVLEVVNILLDLPETVKYGYFKAQILKRLVDFADYKLDKLFNES